MNIIPHPSWIPWFGHEALKAWLVVVGVLRSHPKLWACVGAFVALTVAFGARTSTALPCYLAIPLLPWWAFHRSSFQRWVSQPLRADYRRWWRYKRRWRDVMELNRLSEVIENGIDVYPQLVKVRCHEFGDTVLVRALISQTIEDYQRMAPALQSDFGARECRVYEHPTQRPWWKVWEPRAGVRLEFAYGPDPLAEEIPALPILRTSERIDFSAVQVGLTERGEPWTIDLALHMLLAGTTGSGKSGVLQSLIRGLAPAIRDGRVVIWACDPKEGVEFGPLAGNDDTPGMFARYEDGELEDMAAMLADAVTAMRKQMRKIKAQRLRKHEPTPKMPLVLIIIDEMVDLLEQKGKPKDLSASIHASMGHLLRKGRAAGFRVIGTVTDPRVEASGGFRRSFPVKIGARLDTPDESDMIMGRGAAERGAKCHEIPVELPGVCYVLKNTERDAVRVRAAYVTDDDIEAMVAEYAPAKPVLV